MLKWLTYMTSGRVVTAKNDDDDRDDIDANDDNMMIDLILSEVEAIIFAFETERELHKSQECLRNRIPDYSWLVTDTTQKPKKYLTLSERSQLQRACERIRAEEWSKLISLWKARSKFLLSSGFDLFMQTSEKQTAIANFAFTDFRLLDYRSSSKNVCTRKQIFDSFLSSVHEVILSRPRPTTVSDVVRKYIRSAGSVNAVSDSPRTNGSTHSLGTISLRELNEIV